LFAILLMSSLSIDVFHDNHDQSSKLRGIRILGRTVKKCRSTICGCKEAVGFGVITFNELDDDSSTRLLSVFGFGGS